MSDPQPKVRDGCEWNPSDGNPHAGSDGHCLERAQDGRQCGSYRYLAWFVEWYGWYFACYHCGAMHAEGEHLGKTDVRERWHRRRDEQEAEREEFNASVSGDIELHVPNPTVRERKAADS